MPLPSIPTVTTGDPTKKSHYDALTAAIVYLNSQLGVVNSAGSILTNGSFEVDSDANGVPDGWTKTLQTGGSGTLTGNGLADTVCVSGNRAYKCTSPGGGSNGGCEMQSGFFEVTPLRPLSITWLWYSTAATTANKVEIDYYDASQTFISPTVTVFSQSAGNPSAWTHGFGLVVPPSTARFAKITLIGCDSSSTTAGSTYWDAVSVEPFAFTRRVEFHAVGSNTRTWEWKAQITGPHKITCIGGGASGSHNSGATLQPGGGSGELAQSVVLLTAGTTYTIVSGGGGAAVSSSAGNNGTDSTFATTTVVGKGGSKGIVNSTGGAGGTGGDGMLKVSGCPGDTPAGGRNGNGGDSVMGKAGGIGGTTGVIAIAPLEYSGGAGGAGSNNASESGCVGGGGLVVVEF